MNKDKREMLLANGAAIRRLRRELDMTQSELGAMVGLSAGSIYKIEAGALDARPADLMRIARALYARPQDAVSAWFLTWLRGETTDMEELRRMGRGGILNSAGSDFR